MLAAAWIQFMTRDWFSHGSGDKNNPWQIPLPAGDDFPQNPMLIPKTIADPTRPPDDQRATHARQPRRRRGGTRSQMYPTDEQVADQRAHRQRRQVAAGPAGRRRAACRRRCWTSWRRCPAGGWDSGCCSRCSRASTTPFAIDWQREYPDWSDEQLFQKARLINAALLAKIHTVEWTPAIIAHPTTRFALRGNWWGVGGEQAQSAAAPHLGQRNRPRHSRHAGRASHRAVLADGGVRRRLPHAPVDPRRVLIPPRGRRRHASSSAAFDQVTDVNGNELLQSTPIDGPAVLVRHAVSRCAAAAQLSEAAAALHPTRRQDRGPRRRSTSCACANSACRATRCSASCCTCGRSRPFEDITDNPRWARQMREVYEGRIDRVDLMVGHVRRAQADRIRLQRHGISHLHSDGVAAVEERPLLRQRLHARGVHARGMDWIENTTMSDVLMRHYPGLRGALNPDNAFCAVGWGAGIASSAVRRLGDADSRRTSRILLRKRSSCS